jgi:hypothetical protein
MPEQAWAAVWLASACKRLNLMNSLGSPGLFLYCAIAIQVLLLQQTEVNDERTIYTK